MGPEDRCFAKSKTLKLEGVIACGLCVRCASEYIWGASLMVYEKIECYLTVLSCFMYHSPYSILLWNVDFDLFFLLGLVA